MPILHAFFNYSLEIWAVLFYLGLYALLLKPRWRHYGIAVFAITGNLLALAILSKLSILTGIKPPAYKYGFHLLCLFNLIILSVYCRRCALPAWKTTMITLVGGMFYALLLLALGLRTCHWFGGTCL